MSLTLTVLTDPERGTVGHEPLPLDEKPSRCHVQLRSLPGASGIHLAFAEDERVLLRAEVDTDSAEPVTVEIERDAEGDLDVVSAGRRVFTLPPDERFAPPPICLAGLDECLDLALVVDGTARFWYEEETVTVREAVSRPLLEDAERWGAHVEKIGELVELLAGRYSDLRVAVMAFGDQEMPDVAAPDLGPEYLLYPEPESDRSLQPRSVEETLERLRGVPATTGGDFVDAVADALAACARLRWRREARKLVLLVGDSPGHSVARPLQRGADACVREHDVDVQAEQLHRLGVELVTLYLDPPGDIGLEDVSYRKKLLDATREQYRRLASLPQTALRASGLDSAIAAAALVDHRGPIARGAALGELIQVDP